MRLTTLLPTVLTINVLFDLVEAPTREDIGDPMALAIAAPRVFTVVGWQAEGDFVAELTLQAEEPKRAEVLRALAGLLRARLGAAVQPSGAERTRINMLEKEARNASQ